MRRGMRSTGRRGETNTDKNWIKKRHATEGSSGVLDQTASISNGNTRLVDHQIKALEKQDGYIEKQCHN
jgi:hypothetical protein